MILSEIRIIADILWHEIKNHVKNMELGEFVVMADHVHGILILNGNGENNKNDTINGNPGFTNTLSATNQNTGGYPFTSSTTP